MKIPKKVKIGGITYTVRIVDHRQIENNNVGKISPVKAEILIAECNRQQMAATLLHEVVHGILYQLGQTEEHDEQAVEALSGALHALIVDNPEMFAAQPTNVEDSPVPSRDVGARRRH